MSNRDIEITLATCVGCVLLLIVVGMSIFSLQNRRRKPIELPPLETQELIYPNVDKQYIAQSRRAASL